MAYTVFDVLLAVYDELGLLEDLTATHSSASMTTIEDTDFKLAKPDNWVGGTMFCVRDAGAAGAAPEGEFEVISAFTSNGTTGTFTTSGFSTTVASGDELAVADNTITLKTMLRLLNRALQSVGRIPKSDVSLTAASSTTEYSLPTGINADNIRRVQIRTNDVADDYKYQEITGWWIEHDDSDDPDLGVLHLRREPGSNETLMITYMGDHNQVWGDTDTISDMIHINLLVAELVAIALKWMWRREKKDDTLKDLNEALSERAEARKKYKIIDPGRPLHQVMEPRRGKARSGKYGPWLAE